MGCFLSWDRSQGLWPQMWSRTSDLFGAVGPRFESGKARLFFPIRMTRDIHVILAKCRGLLIWLVLSGVWCYQPKFLLSLVLLIYRVDVSFRLFWCASCRLCFGSCVAFSLVRLNSLPYSLPVVSQPPKRKVAINTQSRGMRAAHQRPLRFDIARLWQLIEWDACIVLKSLSSVRRHWG